MNDPGVAALVTLGLTCFVALVVAGIISALRKQHVDNISTALSELRRLNTQFSSRLSYLPPIQHTFVDVVNPKGRFDRYDLKSFFLERVAAMEGSLQREIDARLAHEAMHAVYAGRYAGLRSRLGESHSEKMPSPRFTRIEKNLFEKRKLRTPSCAAHVTCAVTYTSPKGKNSYSKHRVWNFEELVRGLEEMRTLRKSRSTTAFLRQQERNRMGDRLRAEILKRDKSTCRMCGATPSHGATLHIDHVIPVSKGGKTTRENLQTLCQACNLGKSDVL